jgi:hypothetical protein
MCLHEDARNGTVRVMDGRINEVEIHGRPVVELKAIVAL